MNADSQFDRESRARTWYRRLINLYPGAFRERYAVEMLRVFEEDWRRVGSQRANARRRYWFHVLRDLIGTLPREWLTAMPFEVKAGLAGFGVLVSLYVIYHQRLAVFYWLLLAAFTTALWAILLGPSRFRMLPALLSSIFLGAVSVGAAKLCEGIGHSPYGVSLVFLAGALYIAVFIFVVLGNTKLPRRAARPFWRGLQPSERFRLFSFFVIDVLALRFTEIAVGQHEGFHGIYLLVPSLLLAKQVYEIWRKPIATTVQILWPSQLG
jgi:hypothetical protein